MADCLRREDLKPYQVEMIARARKSRFVALWALMGAGKTVSTLTAIADLVDNGMSRRVLIIAPRRVCLDVWPREIVTWEHLRHVRYSVAVGSATERKAALARAAEVYIINRENVGWLVEYASPKNWPFDTVVIDEADSFRSHDSRRWKALCSVRNRTHRVWELTGTPMPEGYPDLWAPIYLMDGGKRLGRNITEYRERWFDKDFNGYSYKLKPGAQLEIQERIADIVHIVENYDGLPDVNYRDILLTMPEDLSEQYKAFERDQIMALAGTEITAVNAGALVNKLLQFAQGAVYDDEKNYHVVHDIKIQALKDIQAATPGRTLLVAYYYKSDLARLRAAFPEAKTLADGRNVVDDWNARKIPMLLVHPASAGHGLNLQFGGSTIVWFGQQWSGSLYSQLNARLVRRGQSEPVFVHHLILAGTIDEIARRAVDGKNKSQDALIDALRRKIQEYTGK